MLAVTKTWDSNMWLRRGHYRFEHMIKERVCVGEIDFVSFTHAMVAEGSCVCLTLSSAIYTTIREEYPLFFVNNAEYHEALTNGDFSIKTSPVVLLVYYVLKPKCTTKFEDSTAAVVFAVMNEDFSTDILPSKLHKIEVPLFESYEDDVGRTCTLATMTPKARPGCTQFSTLSYSNEQAD